MRSGKQGVGRAEPVEVIADDYATVEGCAHDCEFAIRRPNTTNYAMLHDVTGSATHPSSRIVELNSSQSSKFNSRCFVDFASRKL